MNDKRTYYPLTSYQKFFYYSEIALPGTPRLNILCTIKLFGEIDLQILEKTINLIILKNDSLRLRLAKIDKGLFSIFYKKSSLIKQYVSGYHEKKIEFYRLSMDKTEWIKHQAIKLFNLYDSDLYSFIILELNTGEYALFIRIHHIITDGWSLNLLANQIGEYYTKLKNGLTIDTNQNPSYIDLIIKEKEYKKTEKFIKDKQVWIKKIKNAVESSMFKNKSMISTKGDSKLFELSPEMTETINKLCEYLHIYPSILFTALMVYFIQSKTSEKDITLIMLSHNRVNEREMHTTGMYSRATPICLKLKEKMNLKTLADNILLEYKFALKYGKESVIVDLHEKNRYFFKYNIFIAYEKYTPDSTGVIKSLEYHNTGFKADPFVFRIYEQKDSGYILEYEYRTDFFSDSDIYEMHKEIEKTTIQLGKTEIGQ